MSKKNVTLALFLSSALAFSFVTFQGAKWTVHGLPLGSNLQQAAFKLNRAQLQEGYSRLDDGLALEARAGVVTMVSFSTLEYMGKVLLSRGDSEEKVLESLGKPNNAFEMGGAERKALNYEDLKLQVILKKNDALTGYEAQFFTLGGGSSN